MGEQASVLDAVDEEGPLPELRPILVVAAEDLEEELVDRRAELARRRLQLRALQRGEDHATASDDGDPMDVQRAEAFLRSSLDQQLRQRRAELEAATESARHAAAELVAAAHQEAAALLAAANESIVSTLLQGLTPAVVEPTPTLRVVGPGEDRARDVHPTAPASPAVAPVAIAEPPAPAPAPVAPVVIDVPAGPRWGVRSFLYVDVLLPLIAVVLVLLVLLAWVG